VSQPPSWPYGEPLQRQPSRPSGAPQGSPPPRTPRKSPRKGNSVLVIVLAIAGIFLIGLVASALHSSDKSALASSAATVKASSTAANATAKAADACEKRSPASGDIYVRTVTPGGSAQTRQLGGRWAWDQASNKCLTSVQTVLATAPLGTGHCTQVGYVADNPGYDVKATPAAPLSKVAAQAGPACQAAAPPAPAQTTPAPAQSVPAAAPAAAPATTPAAAPAPAPPAATTPTACSPLSDEGTCYEPGEYCRPATLITACPAWLVTASQSPAKTTTAGAGNRSEPVLVSTPRPEPLPAWALLPHGRLTQGRRASQSVAERRKVIPPAVSTAATSRSWNSVRLSSGRPLMNMPAPWLRVKRQ
jgi:hypothetical protein